MKSESRSVDHRTQIGFLIVATLMIAAFQTTHFPDFDLSWLSWSEMDAISQEKLETIDFTTCRKDPGSPRGELHMIESSMNSPEAVLGKSFSFYPLINSDSQNGQQTEMLVRWTVVPPVESQVSMTPTYADNFQLRPDTEGTYKVRMALFRGNQLCDFKETKIDVKNPKAGDRKKLYLAKRRYRMTA
ncbi:MAG: hypothetical protein K2X47_15130 [Bdellovibrionales bacterium]|nr:hypothetical protein [Bdellovibrionales bacterium]